MEIYKFTISQLHEKLKKDEISCLEITKSYLSRIKKTDEKLNSYITLIENDALEKATYLDKKKIDKGNFDYLCGIPYSAKDNFCTKGIRTTCASKILENYIPPYNSTTINRLEDSVLLGKVNMDQFAMGSSGETSYFKLTKNPYDLKRVPGGTSSGSIVSVAANQAVFSIGTDTGGSVRQPASFCNVVGVRPTYGRTSRYGVIAMASSLDVISCVARNVQDAAIVLNKISGHDKNDLTTPNVEVPDYTKCLENSLKNVKIGFPKEYFSLPGLDKKVRQSIEKAMSKLNELGAEIFEVSLPHTEYAVAVYYVIMPSEVSSNMARFDGIKYGLSDQEQEDLLSVYLNSRKKGLGDEVKRRIMLGTFSLSHGYYDKYYAKAQKVRTLVKQDFENAFKQVDAIISPVSPTVAFKLGEKIDDPLAMYSADVFTIPLSLAGLPAVSVPCSSVGNLPVGMQVIGKQFTEGEILKIAHAYETARGKIDLSLVV